MATTSKPFFSHTTPKPAHTATSTHSVSYSSATPGDEKGMYQETHHVSSDITESEAQHEALQFFHSSLGIPTPKPHKQSKSIFGRKKPPKEHPNKVKLSTTNQGVYHSVMSTEKWARIRYYSINALCTVAMFLQIVVGAAVTALGAGEANHIIITVFGATNTALASLLALLNSKGLPNRLRQDWIGWRELREYIEAKEREIGMNLGGKSQHELKAMAERRIRDIEDRYNAMRLTSETNRPETYIKTPVQKSEPEP